MVLRGVIYHKVEDQANSAPGQFFSSGSQTLGPADMFVHNVASYAIGRPYKILRNKIGKYTGFGPAIDAAWRVGRVVMADLVKNWDKYRDQTPSGKP